MATEVVRINTSGDTIKERSLAEIGGKGLFIKEIEHSLLNGEIDVAVHSLKDIPGNSQNELTIAGTLEREDPRDVFISHYHKNLASLPKNAVIATCAPRRAAQLRPDIIVKPLRGNIETRINKARNFDGIILSLAGLRRTKMTNCITEILPTNVMLPAVGQGVICLQCHKNNKEVIKILEELTHHTTKIVATAERAFLKEVNGDCKTPLAALARITNHATINLKAMLRIEEKNHFITIQGSIKEAAKIGKTAAEEILRRRHS